jgi:hypothetical protein
MMGLPALSGCTELAVRLGLRTRLENVPVSSVSAALVSGRDHTTVNALGPGQSAALVTVNKGGRVSLPADPSLSEGKEGRVRVTLVGHPDVTTELDIPVRYDIAYQANFSGADGMNGMDGFAGLDGRATAATSRA